MTTDAGISSLSSSARSRREGPEAFAARTLAELRGGPVTGAAVRVTCSCSTVSYWTVAAKDVGAKCWTCSEPLVEVEP